jgi:Tfp pilus assembly protein PilN
MIGVNLIPSSVLTARQRSRRIRRWAAVILVIAIASATPVLYQVRQHVRIASMQEGKQQQEARLASTRAELVNVNRSLAELNRRIERTNALRTKRSWTGLLALIVECMPQEIWLTSLSTDAPTAGRKARSRPQEAPESETDETKVVVMAGARRLDLDGYATELEHLYDFITRLKASGVFAKVELVKADAEPTFRTKAVHFELTCGW